MCHNYDDNSNRDIYAGYSLSELQALLSVGALFRIESKENLRKVNSSMYNVKFLNVLRYLSLKPNLDTQLKSLRGFLS